MTQLLCVTGIGMCSAIGDDLETYAAHLRSGTSGVRPTLQAVPGIATWAGLAGEADGSHGSHDREPPALDRAAQLAIRAADRAWADAFGHARQLACDRVGLVLGTSHGGRSELDACAEDPGLLDTTSGARRVLFVALHHRQTGAVARHLGIHGPVATISSACSSSGAAIAYAFELLLAGRADHVLAGGMDGFSRLTWAGFNALGAVASEACGPFSRTIGISLGEGAAVLVLETFDRAAARGARIHAELLGHGSSWDCYHITEPEPSGDGIVRATTMAVARAGVEPGDIDYVNLHGTGTRANDAAETLALKRFFGAAGPPPASSTKSFTGHTLGAAAAFGCLSAIAGMRDGLLPPTTNFTGPRAGCDLDYVPNVARQGAIDVFSSQAAGFGGVNTVLIGAAPGRARRPRTPVARRIGITGIGLVSPIGHGACAFREALREGRCGIAPVDRFSVAAGGATRAGLVRGLDVRRAVPSLNLRRSDPVIQYAAVAGAQAIDMACLAQRGLARDRIGLVVGTTRGAVTSVQRSLERVRHGQWLKASALHFPNLVMSSAGWIRLRRPLDQGNGLDARRRRGVRAPDARARLRTAAAQRRAGCPVRDRGRRGQPDLLPPVRHRGSAYVMIRTPRWASSTRPQSIATRTWTTSSTDCGWRRSAGGPDASTSSRGRR